MTPSLQLPLQQIANHLPTRYPRRLPQRRDIQGTRQAIRKAKEQHRWDPTASVLHREAPFGHLVLFDIAASQVVYATWRVYLCFVLAWHVSELCASEDVEVVVRCVTAGVALSTNSGTKDDEVLSNT